MRIIAHIFKTTKAADARVLRDSRYAAHIPVFTGSMVSSLFCRQSGMNT